MAIDTSIESDDVASSVSRQDAAILAPGKGGRSLDHPQQRSIRKWQQRSLIQPQGHESFMAGKELSRWLEQPCQANVIDEIAPIRRPGCKIRAPGVDGGHT